jgi:rhamnosyltransferase
MSYKVSIIIRTKNEEKWISSCLKAVAAQSYKNFEVILVDNNSTDKTVDIAKQFNVKVVTISEFRPGKAINDGIRASKGQIIVCLSGHCIPVNEYWLENLINNLNDERVAGVYGRQQPMSFSSDIDKRDLFNLFGFDKRIQIKDSFFHNANSAFRREIWEQFPFDENLTNIEDRVWGSKVIKAGLTLVYEPDSSVYHWHGVHQDANPIRAKKIVRIFEEIPELKTNESYIKASDHKICLIIPIKGKYKQIGDKSLLEILFESIKNSNYTYDIFVATDNKETAELAKKIGFKVPFLRPSKLSLQNVSIFDVVNFFISQLEKKSIYYDVVGVMTENYPFRRKGVFDEMLTQFIRNSLDTLLAGRIEDRSGFIVNDDKVSLFDEGFMPRDFKSNQLIIGLMGYGCITRPFAIRNNQIFESQVSIFTIYDYLESFEIRSNVENPTQNSLDIIDFFLK